MSPVTAKPPTHKNGAQPAPCAAVQPAEYVLGTGSDESVRLGLQHRLWSESAHALWERAGLQPGQTVMDLGCGPGHASVDMAQIVGPRGRIIAIDESAGFLKQLRDQAESRRLTNIERVLGDVQQLGECIQDGAGTIDRRDPPPLSAFTRAERRVLARVRTPTGVQRYLNGLPYNTEPAPGGATLRSFRGVVRHHTAHCLEAAIAAAVILEHHGWPPLVLSFESVDELEWHGPTPAFAAVKARFDAATTQD